MILEDEWTTFKTLLHASFQTDFISNTHTLWKAHMSALASELGTQFLSITHTGQTGTFCHALAQHKTGSTPPHSQDMFFYLPTMSSPAEHYVTPLDGLQAEEL